MSFSSIMRKTFSADDLLLQVQMAIYESIAPLEIAVWRTAEPVGFARRESGERMAGRVGEPWARQLFDCAWMRFRARLPEGVDPAGLLARIDVNGELCVVDAAGVPVRGLTNIKSTFDPKLGGPGKTVYALPPEAIRDGAVELWADAGLNDLFGFVKNEGRVELAEIVRVRAEVRALYYDLETLRDYGRTLPEDSTEASRLQEDFAVLAEELDCGDEAAVIKARQRLAVWFQSREKPALQIHAIGHAHLDLAWLWPLRETIRKDARTFATVLYNSKRYPEYVFGCSQAQLFAWMKTHHPPLYAQIKQAVRAGRIEPLGTFWVEPDGNMPSGESFVRQILRGRRFFQEEFGWVPVNCWQPDVFGCHGQLPQILKKSGHDFFMTQKLSWNVVNRFPHHSFHWEGIDGTRILAHMLPEDTYNGPAAARSLQKIAECYQERAVSDHALMAFGIGDGGGGPDAEHLERLRRAPRLPGLPTAKIGSVAEFFEVWSGEAAKFPLVAGELYLERHQGTLTTQALVKRNNRRTEIALREAEWAAYLSARYAVTDYPVEALDRLWEEALLYQFHDILPGSSIKRVYDECNARYECVLAELADLTQRHYQAVAAACGDAAVGTVGQVFNSLSWPRSEWLRLGETWRWVQVPALGWARIDAPSSAPADGVPGVASLKASVRGLENECLRVSLAADGRIASIFDRRAGREVLAEGARANDFVVIADEGDVWDFEIDHAKRDVWGYLRRPEQRPVLAAATAEVDGPCASVRQVWRFRDSEIRQVIRLWAGAEQLEFETEVDWRESATMLRVRFPVAVRADEARFEIPFGHIRRSTGEETSRERAQIEVAALQWVDLSGADYGVALLNDCKHGFRIKGHTIDMALIRSVPYPGAPLINKGDVSPSGSAAVYTDLGPHAFRYALRPHAGPGDAAELTAAARALNTPLAVVFADVAQEMAVAAPAVRAGVRPSETERWWQTPDIELAAVKPADSGSGWVWRLVNLTERPVTIEAPPDKACWQETDLIEQPLRPLGARVEFGPFEIKTLRQRIPEGRQDYF